MDRSTTDSTSRLDRAAIALSGLCVLHCLATPLLLVLLPFAGQLSANHFHLQMLALVVPASSVALGLGFRRHRNTGIVFAGLAGMLLLFAGATWAHTEIGIAADRMFTIAGSSILAIAHFYNGRRARCSQPSNLSKSLRP